MKDMLQIEFFKRLLWMWTEEGCKLNFFGNILVYLHSLSGIIDFKPNCRMRWIFMDFLTELGCFLLFQILLFKIFLKIYQTETSFWNLEKCQNSSFPVWESMPSWVLVSIFKCKIDHIGGKNKFQINFGKNNSGKYG